MEARKGKIKNCPKISDVVAAGKSEAEFKAMCKAQGVAMADMVDCIARFKKAVEDAGKPKRNRTASVVKVAKVEAFVDFHKDHFGALFQGVKDVLAKIKAIKTPSKSQLRAIDKARKLLEAQGFEVNQVNQAK